VTESRPFDGIAQDRAALLDASLEGKFYGDPHFCVSVDEEDSREMISRVGRDF
jgi:hypothetical protein